MKNLFQIFFLMLTVIAFPAITVAQQNFTLTGKFKNIKNAPQGVYMKSMEDTSTYKVPVINGNYIIKGKLNGPTKFNILPIYSKAAIRPAESNKILFLYLENGNSDIIHDHYFSNFRLSGSPPQQAYNKLTILIKQFEKNEADELHKKEVYGQYLKANISSPIAVYALANFLSMSRDLPQTTINYNDIPFSIKNAYLLYQGRIDYNVAMPLFHKLPNSLQQSSAGKNLLKNIEWAKLDWQSLVYRRRLDSLMELYITAVKQKDNILQNKYERQMDVTQREMFEQVYRNYIRTNPTSPIALDLLGPLTGSNFDDPIGAKTLFSLLSDSLKKTKEGENFDKRLSKALKTANGSFAPDIMQPDTAGKAVSLSSFKGKYVLLDFWASWCHPCREENPNMLKLYAQFKDKGFTILSVSLDTDRKNWINAIKQDGLPWTQVSDLKNKNEAVQQYDILGIPANLLIGPDGKIIGKNLFGHLLEQQLIQLIN